MNTSKIQRLTAALGAAFFAFAAGIAIGDSFALGEVVKSCDAYEALRIGRDFFECRREAAK